MIRLSKMLCNKCSSDSAIHSQLDFTSVRGYQEDFVVFMDQALYAKACEVAWKHKDLYA